MAMGHVVSPVSMVCHTDVCQSVHAWSRPSCKQYVKRRFCIRQHPHAKASFGGSTAPSFGGLVAVIVSEKRIVVYGNVTLHKANERGTSQKSTLVTV